MILLTAKVDVTIKGKITLIDTVKPPVITTGSATKHSNQSIFLNVFDASQTTYL